jgi:hypothetical protein
MAPPKIIFVVPYRDREQQMFFFKNYMKYVLEDYAEDECEIYFSHQMDGREFNRGATKNIGFMAMRDKYPNDYKNITFVFNDIDTIPHKKGLFDYETKKGVIKHFYGFRHALGGFFSIKGVDFERLNGFINNWGWGYEDNALNVRADKAIGITIDRSHFWDIGNNNIIQLFDSVTRSLNFKNKDNFLKDNINDGLTTIQGVKYKIQGDMINIETFNTMRPYVEREIKTYNLFTPGRTQMHKMRGFNEKKPPSPLVPQSQRPPPPKSMSVGFHQNTKQRRMFKMF